MFGTRIPFGPRPKPSLKDMKNLKFNILVLLVSALMLSFATACGDDEPDNPWNNEEEEEQETPAGPSENKDNIQKLIKEHVTVNASYGEYKWRFHIESTLQEVLPDSKIQFGIGHGNVYGDMSVSVENQAYSYSSHMNGDTKIMDFVNPFWFYYMFGIPDPDKDAWTDAEMYYRSYMTLKNQGSLDKYEQANLKEFKRLLDKLEAPTRKNYTPSVEVLIDNKKFYTVGTYKL